MTAIPHKTDEQARAAAKWPGYELSDVPPRGVAVAAIGLIAGILVSLGLVAGLFILFAQFGGPSGRMMPEAARPAPPGPPLEISPQSERAAVETAARQRLSGYGWVDRPAGRARIPIGRAMDILAERGWPDADSGGGKSR